LNAYAHTDIFHCQSFLWGDLTTSNTWPIAINSKYHRVGV